MAKRDKMVCFRVTLDERKRIDLVVQRAQSRNALAVKSDVIKDLMGLTNLGLVEDGDRQLLQADTVPPHPSVTDTPHDASLPETHPEDLGEDDKAAEGTNGE